MKKIILILSFIVFQFAFAFNIKALSYGGCEYSEISKLKSFVSNISLTYDYYIRDNKAYFNITLSNLVPNLYFVDSNTGKTYNYSNSVDGETTITDVDKSGYYKFYSAKQECYGVKLGDKYYKLPTYNFYYTDSLCLQNKNYSLCQKWVSVNYSYNEFQNLIREYKKNQQIVENEDKVVITYEESILDKFVKFYTKYYHVILISIIVLCVIIMFVSRRKNRFNL